MKKEKINREKTFLLLGLIMGIMIGILIGIILQQMVFKSIAVEFGESLEGTTFNIEVDINETVLVDRFTEVFIPIFNETIQESRGEGE